MVLAVILTVLGFLYWKSYYTSPPPVEETAEAGGADLGTEIYQDVNNPLQGELPDNPLDGVYKNPFE